MEEKRYSCWFIPANRWTNAMHRDHRMQQDPDHPFLLSLEEATRWRNSFQCPSDFLVREVNDESMDAAKRQEHAMKYL